MRPDLGHVENIQGKSFAFFQMAKSASQASGRVITLFDGIRRDLVAWSGSSPQSRVDSSRVKFLMP